MTSNAICDRFSYERLSRPLPAWSPRRWYYNTARGLMRSAARLSTGIGIGERYGYDSGVMLEHVYRNKAQGANGIGRAVDRAFLNAPGWRGIRERGAILTATLRDEIERKPDAHVLDVACGGGRYVLEALATHRGQVASVLLRDYRQENIDSAAELSNKLGVAARFERADAFSDEDLARVSPRPDLIIISGLHEIIADDGLIERHFQQLARIAARPATIVFTIQPRHPQVEFIARVLKSHTGKPWVMRLRPQETTRRWAEAAGFRIRSTTMDKQRIFGVVVADLD